MIGIYKPAKKVYFRSEDEDHAAWSSEVIKLAQILAGAGHRVQMLSETDLDEPEHAEGEELFLPGIMSEKKMKKTQKYNITFVFCGAFYSSERDELAALEKIRKQSKKVVLVVTDMTLIPTRADAYKYFDIALTQTTRHIPQLGMIEQRYVDLVYLTGFGAVQSNAKKTNDFVFGGSERKRLNDFLEYVWRPGHVVYTRSPFLDINTKVSRTEYMKKMDESLATICIADEHYNQFGFVTHRPIECAISNVLAFADNKYDPDYLLIPKDSYLRVNNYKEFKERLEECKVAPELVKSLLDWQKATWLNDDIINGSLVYDQLRYIIPEL